MLHKAILLSLTAACLLASLPVCAQYYDPPPYRRAPRYYDDGGPPPGGYYRRERHLGEVCVTSRGNCPTSPGPIGIRCRCDIPGFGKKHGSIE